jgi:hypothetical protein
VQERFRPFLDQYEAELVRRKDVDQKAKVVAFRPGDLVMLERPPLDGFKSQIFLEHMTGPYRVLRSVNHYRVILEGVAGGPPVPQGGEEVAVGRLVKVPPGPDLEVSPGPAVAGEGPPRALSEAERRTCNRLTSGLLVLFRRQDEAGLGEIQQNQNRRMVLVVAEFALVGGEWQRVYLDEDGTLTHSATGRPAQYEVPYLDVWRRVRFRAGVQSLDSTSARLLEAHRLGPEVHGAPARCPEGMRAIGGVQGEHAATRGVIHRSN